MLTTIVLATILGIGAPFHFLKVKKLTNRVADLNRENRNLTECLVMEKPKRIAGKKNPIKQVMRLLPTKEILEAKKIFDALKR